MAKDMIVLQDKEPRAGSYILSQGFKVEHRALRKLVIKYRTDFETFGVITSRMQKPTSKGGRPIEEFLLNEEQAIYIGTLLTNSEIVRQFKMKLVKEFSKIRKALALLVVDKRNSEYIENRKKGILIRKEETDIIKDFVNYAKGQGSQSAEKYYMNISKMENQALFLLEQKFPNLREMLNLKQLTIIACADQVVFRWLKIGMDQGLPYKAIYQLAKEKVLMFGETIGKTPVPNMIDCGKDQGAIENSTTGT